MEVFPNSRENRIQRGLQPLITLRVGNKVITLDYIAFIKMNWLDDLKGSFQF